jgi:hypothetical protein
LRYRRWWQSEFCPDGLGRTIIAIEPCVLVSDAIATLSSRPDGITRAEASRLALHFPHGQRSIVVKHLVDLSAARKRKDGRQQAYRE